MRPDLATQRAAIVVQQNGKGGIKKFTPRQDDEVETGHRLVVSEKLTHPALRVIASNRLPQTPRRDDTQPAEHTGVR